jgi:hypothetical protein
LETILTNQFWKILAFAALAVLAWRELRSPAPAAAQAPLPTLFIEPGTVDIPLADGGNAIGKVVVDLSTGDTYGFPVFGPKLPYPGWQVSERKPLTSRPVYLGRFDFSRMSPTLPRPFRRD